MEKRGEFTDSVFTMAGHHDTCEYPSSRERMSCTSSTDSIFSKVLLPLPHIYFNCHFHMEYGYVAQVCFELLPSTGIRDVHHGKWLRGFLLAEHNEG